MADQGPWGCPAAAGPARPQFLRRSLSRGPVWAQDRLRPPHPIPSRLHGHQVGPAAGPADGNPLPVGDPSYRRVIPVGTWSSTGCGPVPAAAASSITPPSFRRRPRVFHQADQTQTREDPPSPQKGGECQSTQPSFIQWRTTCGGSLFFFSPVKRRAVLPMSVETIPFLRHFFSPHHFSRVILPSIDFFSTGRRSSLMIRRRYRRRRRTHPAIVWAPGADTSKRERERERKKKGQTDVWKGPGKESATRSEMAVRTET